MSNLYWPIYKNLEKEVVELSNWVHFDDKQLFVYSVKISELLIRCSVLRDPLIISPKRNHVRIDFEQAGLQLRASLPSLLCS